MWEMKKIRHRVSRYTKSFKKTIDLEPSTSLLLLLLPFSSDQSCRFEHLSHLLCYRVLSVLLNEEAPISFAFSVRSHEPLLVGWNDRARKMLRQDVGRCLWLVNLA